jgi:CheY-like chemotaxis protein
VPGRVLVVEDDRCHREVLAELLGEFAYLVECAADGAQALRFARQRRPDLILLDLNLPAMTGFEFLRRKALDASLAALPVVIMTAMTPHGRRFGAENVPEDVPLLVKPFASAELIAVIEEAIGG